MDVGCRLKEIRQAQRMSQCGLAQKAGVAQSFISEIESGAASPTIRTLARLSHALGIPLLELIDTES